jgi:hypothetical protein
MVNWGNHRGYGRVLYGRAARQAQAPLSSLKLGHIYPRRSQAHYLISVTPLISLLIGHGFTTVVNCRSFLAETVPQYCVMISKSVISQSAYWYEIGFET